MIFGFGALFHTEANKEQFMAVSAARDFQHLSFSVSGHLLFFYFFRNGRSSSE